MSSKTPKSLPNETKSAPSSRTSSAEHRSPKRLLLAVAIILFGCYILGSGIAGLLDNKSRLIAPSGVVSIETVDSPEARTLGLSNRASIDENAGMLFVFDETVDTNCFWMKDMQFAIDMVWLDDDKKVVTVEESVEPSTFPKSFCPESAAKYGLEIQAKQANKLGIVPGETLKF